MAVSARSGCRCPEKASVRPTNAPSGRRCRRCVLADVAHVQIEQAVVVVVEEHRARRVADVIHAGRFRNVLEMAEAVVLEQHVAFADRRDEEVLVTVVVDVGERGGHADPAARATPAACDVPELSAAGILRARLPPT